MHEGAGRVLGERGFDATAAGDPGPQRARPTRAGGPAARATLTAAAAAELRGGDGEVAWPDAGDPVGIREAAAWPLPSIRELGSILNQLPSA